MGATKGRKAKKIVSKSIHRGGKAVLKAKMGRRNVKVISKNISKNILRNASSPAKAKKLALQFAMKILKNPKATRTHKLLALKVFKNVTKNLNRRKNLTHRGQKSLKKILHVIPRGHLSN